MRRIAYGLLSTAYCLLLSAQSKPSDDLCTLPPSNARPSLPAQLLPGQGRIHMPITTRSPEAQAFFDQGVAQMHSFWSREAERSFLQAAQLDPEAPMPQWGIAMVASGDYRPGFQLMDDNDKIPAPKLPARRTGQSGIERAVEAAQKAHQLSANATPREKAYIAAIAARRNLESKDPYADYVQKLRELVRQFPEENEARSYLALALMRGYTTPDKRPREGTAEAVALLREVLKNDPDHVGAHHYVIHVLEGSTRPQDAWASCKRYPELAPEIPHALHMPGHIYVQSDRWADAATAFDQAARKERELLAADQLYPNGHHGHNVHFLTTTYMFLGNYGGAMAASDELLHIAENPREARELTNSRTAYRQGWFARLRTLVAFRKWDEVLDAGTLPEYPGPRERAWRHWARGLAYAARSDVAQARAEAKLMDEQMKEWRKAAGSDSPHLRTAHLELLGHIEVHARHAAKGLDTVERAGRMELALRYQEPAAYPRPVWEAMGHDALEARQWSRAEAAFRRALEQNPGSAAAKEGLSAALSRSAPPVLAAAGGARSAH